MWQTTPRRSNSCRFRRLILHNSRNYLCNQPKPLAKNERLRQRFHNHPHCEHINPIASTRFSSCSRSRLFSSFSIRFGNWNTRNPNLGNASCKWVPNKKNNSIYRKCGFLVRCSLSVKRSCRYEKYINRQPTTNYMVSILGSYNYADRHLNSS